MSTAGKVLAVLVALTTIAWVVLASMAAQLNRNWGEQIHRLTQQVETLEQQVEQNLAAVDQARRDLVLEQDARARDVRVLQVAIEDVRNRLADVVESQERVRYQLESYRATLAGAQEDLERRRTEQAETEQALADARAEVERLKGTDAELLSRLTELRQEFKSTTEENRQLLAKIRESAGPRTRPASLSR